MLPLFYNSKILIPNKSTNKFGKNNFHLKKRLFPKNQIFEAFIGFVSSIFDFENSLKSDKFPNKPPNKFFIRSSKNFVNNVFYYTKKTL